MISCPSCGASLKYDISSAKLTCEHCSQSFDPYVLDQTDKDAVLQESFQTKVWICPGCGATIETADDSDITAVCTYCGGNRIIFDKIKESQRPEKIIPFKLTKEDCKKIYQKAARRAFLSPGRLLGTGAAESFRGIYMPYVSYNGDFECDASVPMMDAWISSGNQRTRDLYDMKSHVVGSYEIQRESSKQFDDALSDAIAPYSEESKVPFTPGYLCGFYAETPTDQPSATELSEDIEHGIRLNACTYSTEEYEPDTKRSVQCENYRETGKQHINLFPVWFMANREKDKLTYSVINGETGKMAADFPISVGKLFLFAALLFVALFGLMNFVDIMMMPKLALSLSFVLAAVAWRMTNKNFKMLRVRDHITPEKKRSIAGTVLLFFLLFVMAIVLVGVGGVRCESEILWYDLVLIALYSIVIRNHFTDCKTPMEKFGFILMLCGWLFTVSILLIEPVNEAYWLVGVINSVIFFFQMLTSISSFNKLAYRKPPQFNKKGGDDNA